MNLPPAARAPRFRPVLLAFVGTFFFLLGATAALSQQSAPNASAPAATSSAASPPPSIPLYPNTPKGLENLVKDMLKIEKEGDHQKLALYAKSLTLPDPDGWFKSVFGELMGEQLEMNSTPARTDLENSLPAMLSDQLREKRTDVEVVRFDDSCSPRATEVEYPFLLLRQRPEPLYDVRFLGSSMANIWSYLAYVDGAYRFIGNLKVKGVNIRYSNPHPADSHAIPLAGIVMLAKRIHAAVPVYPPEARAARLQGTVLLRAIIAKDGSIRNLHILEGQCWLAQSAMNAVKDWRYRPTLLNDQPVEVDTTISVIYTLGR